MKHLLFLMFAFVSGCSTIDQAQIDRHIHIVYASQAAENHKTPFVILMQGSGGGLGQSQGWANWFSSLGISSVLVDSAKLRNTPHLLAVSYDRDVALAITKVMGDSRLDVKRYAVMGFSKGGTAAMHAGGALASLPQPSDVFALYPGDSGQCSHTHQGAVSIHVFYGESDVWGNHQGTRNACERQAKSDTRVKYYSFPNAHHQYDHFYEGTWSCCGVVVLSKPDPTALAETRKVVLSALTKSWKL